MWAACTDAGKRPLGRIYPEASPSAAVAIDDAVGNDRGKGGELKVSLQFNEPLVFANAAPNGKAKVLIMVL